MGTGQLRRWRCYARRRLDGDWEAGGGGIMQQVGVNQRLKQLQGSTTGCEPYFGTKLDSRTVLQHPILSNQIVNLGLQTQGTRKWESFHYYWHGILIPSDNCIIMWILFVCVTPVPPQPVYCWASSANSIKAALSEQLNQSSRCLLQLVIEYFAQGDQRAPNQWQYLSNTLLLTDFEFERSKCK